MKKEFLDKISAENSMGKPVMSSMHSQEVTQSGSTNVIRSSAFNNAGRFGGDKKIMYREDRNKKLATM